MAYSVQKKNGYALIKVDDGNSYKVSYDSDTDTIGDYQWWLNFIGEE